MKKSIIKDYNINSPINLELQKIATRSLRNGLIKYDKEKDGEVLLPTYKIQKWFNDKDLKKYNLEKSIGWELAIIKEINQFNADIETKNNTKGKISYIKILLGQKKSLMIY